MKSLNFSIESLRDKLFQGEKTQTIRTNFIPGYEISQIIWIKYLKIRLYQGKVEDLYPKQLKNVTLEEAKRDGFKNIKECITTVMLINKIKSRNHWCFITRWESIDIPPFEELIRRTTISPNPEYSIINYLIGDS